MKEQNFTIIRTRSREEIVLEVQKARETIAALSKQQDAVVQYINDLVRALQPEIVLFPKRPPSDLRLIKPAAEIEESGKEGLEDQECESCGCSRKQPVDLKTIVIRGFMAVIFLLVLNAVIMGAVLSDQLKARSKHPAAEMTNSTRAIESLLEFPEEKRTLPAMLTRKIRRH